MSSPGAIRHRGYPQLWLGRCRGTGRSVTFVGMSYSPLPTRAAPSGAVPSSRAAHADAPRRQPARALVEHLATTRTVLTRAQVLTQFSEHALRRGLARHEVVAVLPGIYAARALRRDTHVRVHAAAAWAGDAGRLTGLAALWWHGIVPYDPTHVSIQLSVPLHLERPPWLRVARPGMDPTDVEHRGVHTVHPADAVVQAWIETRGSIGLVCDVVRCGGATVEEIRDAAVRRPRVSGRMRLMALLGHLAQGVTSFLEYQARVKVFPRELFPELELQYVVTTSRGRRVIDAAAADLKIAMEFDGTAYHGSDEQRRADLERDKELAMLGFVVLRFTYEDLMRRPEWCREVYRATRRARQQLTA